MDNDDGADDDEALVNDDVPCEVAPTPRAAPPVVVSSVHSLARSLHHTRFSLAVIVEALIEQRRERPSVE